MLEVMPVAISFASLDDQRIISVNRRFTELFGYVLGDHATVTDWIEQTYLNPQHAERARKHWAQHFDPGRVATVEIPQVELDVRCKDGSIKTTLLSSVIMPDVGWVLAMFIDVTERTRLALEDPLTGLPNRRAFMNTLKTSIARARRRHSSVALLMVDLDGFKPLNDTYGHDVGDRVLRLVAEKLNHAIRADDFVCRIGGDEFGVIVDSCDTPAIAEQVASRVIAEVSAPFRLSDHEIRLGASVGIGFYPADADTEEGLMKIADSALYRAKNSGRSRWSR